MSRDSLWTFSRVPIEAKGARAAALAILSIVMFPGCDQGLSLTTMDREIADEPTYLARTNSLAVPHVKVTVTNETRSFDLGKIDEGGELRHIFAIRNTTERPLTVVAIKKSCGCETANIAEGTVVPSGELLEVAYALSKYGAGERKGQLVITTDANEESLRVIELRLRGEIQPKLGGE